MADNNEELKKRTKETAEIVEDAFRRISENIKDIFDEAIDGADNFSKSLQKDISRSLNQIAKSSSKLLTENQEKLNRGNLTRAQIDKQILSLNSKLAALEIQKNVAIRNNLADAAKLNTEYETAALYNKELVKELEEQAKQSDKIKNKLGLTGALLKGISKIPFLNNIVDTDKALFAAAQSSSKIGATFAALKSISQDIFKHLIDPLTLLLMVFDLDKKVGDLAKGLDISYSSAANLRKELTDIANASGDTAVTTKGLQESLLAVSQTLGVNARLSEQDLIVFTKLREQAGYTNEELVSFQKIAIVNNKTVGDISKSFLGTITRLSAQNKLAINAKQIYKEISKVSDAIKLSVGGTAEKIAEAAFKAKQFGINLDQADRISESLLNFESSISNELSAELITGKDLNLEKARLLALNGDIAGASAEILQQVKGSAEFTKMNRIQQEALAKAVGMSREDLAASLVEREAAVKLGAKEGQSTQDRYNELVKTYGIEKANAMLGDEALERQFQQQSVQERFTQSIEKLKEIFVTIAEPLIPVLNVFAEIFKFVGPIVSGVASVVKYVMDWGKYLLPIIAAYKTFQVTSGIVLGIQAAFNKEKAFEYITSQKTLAAKIGERTYAIADLVIQKAKNSTLIKNIFLQNQSNIVGKKGVIQSIADAAMSAIKGFTSLGPLGIALGLAAAGTVAALGYKYLKGDDVMSEGGYGNRTLLTPKGSIALNNNDTVIAGTNLGGKGKSNPTPPQQDLSPLLEEMRAMRQETARSNNKPVVVDNNIDGTKFGTAIAMNKYKIQ